MSKYTENFRLGSAVMIVFVILSPAAIAESKHDDFVVRTKELVNQLYPDLSPNLRAVIREGTSWINEDMNSLELELYNNPLQGGVPQPSCWCSSPVLRVHAFFIFDEQGESRLSKFGIAGPLAFGGRDRFAKVVDKHPKWSDAQIVAELNQAGARFGPDHKAEFLRGLPTEILKPYLGDNIELLDATFSFRSEVTPRNISIASSCPESRRVLKP